MTEQEVNAATHSTVVNEAFVRRYFAGGDALGRVIRVPRLRTPPLSQSDDSFQIAGVVGDTVNRANKVLLTATATGQETMSLDSVRQAKADSSLIYSQVTPLPANDPRTTWALWAGAPDGDPRIFIAQKGGQIRIVVGGALLATPFLNLTGAVSTGDEQGLLGVAFHPSFPAQPYVYVYYTATTPVLHNRVSRFTASGDVAVRDDGDQPRTAAAGSRAEHPLVDLLRSA